MSVRAKTVERERERELLVYCGGGGGNFAGKREEKAMRAKRAALARSSLLLPLSSPCPALRCSTIVDSVEIRVSRAVLAFFSPPDPGGK